MRRAPDRKRAFRLDDAGYRRLGSRLRTAQRSGRRQQTTDLIRLLALTGCRRGELEGLTRAEVDLAGSALRLGDTKTGRSVRPLSRAAAVILRAAMKRSRGANVFPALRGEGYHKSLPKAWGRILARLLGLTPHGLRHSFASVAEDLGVTVPTIAALLGHAGTGVTAGYIHKLDPAPVAAANRVAERMDRPPRETSNGLALDAVRGASAA